MTVIKHILHSLLYNSGESSAGKSTFLNLILGEEVLPSSVLSTTCTICELKYAKERCLVAHFKTKDPKTGLLTKRIKLKKPENCGNKSYLDQITPYVHLESNRESGSEYKKVEIFWPHELLQVIIKNHKPTIQKNKKTRLENFFSSSSSCLKILNL